jgi:hypothetical protein
VRLLLLLAAAAAAVPFAAAALTAITGGAVGSGSAVVAACDADGFGASYATSGGAITAVTVTEIADPGCEGGVMRVAIVDGAGVSIGSGGPVTIAVDGDAADNVATVPVAGSPAALSAQRVHVVVEGP